MPIGFTGQGAIWYTNTAPAGWLICDGSLVDKIKYPDLWQLLGDTWGASTTTQFYLPDLRGRTAAGKAASGTFGTFASYMGNDSIDSSHQHDTAFGWDGTSFYSEDTSTSSGSPLYGSDVQTVARAMFSRGTRTSTASRSAYTKTAGSATLSIVQPTTVINYIIKT